MPSATSVTLTVRAVDQTARTLAGVRARVAALGARLRLGVGSAIGAVGSAVAALPSLIGGALGALRNGLLGATAAAAGLVLAIRQAANSAGRLSDLAAMTGSSARELDALSGALGVLGSRQADVESIAQALARMTRATGRTGVGGLRETLAEIAGMGSEAERVQALSNAFGRAFGPGLARLVRNGPQALADSLDRLMQAMPALSDGLAAQGDALADGFSIAEQGIRVGWQSMLIELGQALVGRSGMSAREAFATIGAYASTYGQILGRNMEGIIDRIVAIAENAGTMIRDLFSVIGQEISDMIPDWHETWVGQFGDWAGTRLATAGSYIAGDLSGTWDQRVAQRKADLEMYRNAHRSRGASASLAEEWRRITADAAPIDWAPADLLAELDKKLEAIRGIDAAAEGSPLASLEEMGEAADSATAALGQLRDATAIQAGSAESLALLTHAAQASMGGVSSSNAPAARTAAATARTADNTSELLELQREQLALQRDAAPGLAALAAVGSF